MRFSLRTLIVVMLLGGPACAWGWWEWKAHVASHALRRAREKRVAEYRVAAGHPVSQWRIREHVALTFALKLVVVLDRPSSTQ